MAVDRRSPCAADGVGRAAIQRTLGIDMLYVAVPVHNPQLPELASSGSPCR